uniref:DNA-(apurinic or apyrimidinic site) endonuclease 2 n=1 Tax=Letharia vulpina TaxID=129387 RepID=A0A7G3WA08_LETVU|nr:abasic endonuclease/DNA lyase [Letharia vulpina]
MGLRITTWNVNGIRNPFGYQPWRDKRSFAAMFDILEADIVVFQETKIQRKDLSDDMVLVPGWDCYFSLPRHKKGYSGVVIYTRQSVCAPIRAEEGITGLLCSPNSSTNFSNLPEEQQIGGYPTPAQLAASAVDATTLDAEGRSVVLEFPAFVLFGVYSPANRDETRDDFRLGFLDVLDARIRNLIAMGKRVFLTGDFNISREELDAANAEVSMRKQGLTGLEFVSTPARRLFNHLLEGGKVFGERDEGREHSVLWDICRAFHPDRKGMFTCWEQKVNARPGNCGARIDYVLCSLTMKDWFSDSNIQEGLMGSDHCPVYAVMKDAIFMDGVERDLRDVMNPPGMFSGGKRQREYSATSDPLPSSGKLIPEFFGRRNIRDMFAQKPSLPQSQSNGNSNKVAEVSGVTAANQGNSTAEMLGPIEETAVEPCDSSVRVPTISPSAVGQKRSAPATTGSKSTKRGKSVFATAAAPMTGKGQQSLKGFFKPSAALISSVASAIHVREVPQTSLNDDTVGRAPADLAETYPAPDGHMKAASLESAIHTPRKVGTQHIPGESRFANASPIRNHKSVNQPQENVHDPVQSKESWSKLFTKPAAPRCEGHDEPCISLLTKKPGMNLGRSFWMCPRPLGPSGAKEKNTQWRCQTFIWCSDWNPNATNG